jgi:hypothetical protein
MTARIVYAAPATSFGDDLKFLGLHTPVVVLSDRDSGARVAVTPAWQGRVMTSSADGEQGMSFGWINRKLIAAGAQLPHFNPLGGEDRIWLGPEGGQFSIYFSKGAPFDLEHWFVPKALDTGAFEVTQEAGNSVSLQTRFQLTNYSGTQLAVSLTRTVSVLDPRSAWEHLGLLQVAGVSLVAYASRNTLTNVGESAWKQETGLLSIWILGMFNPSPEATIVTPVRPGSETELGRIVTSDYFGSIPADRLHVTDRAVFLKGDGNFRSKVGVNPRRSLAKLGSYDPQNHVLTIVQFDQPQGVTDYVNSLWKIQRDPFAGDAANAYNDGPPAPGVPPMGPFFELESSSPAAALAPGTHLTHTHRTFHLVGARDQLDAVAQAVLGVSIADIEAAFTTKRVVRGP